MDTRTIANLISVPLFTGVIGFVTNWTGVLMLFRPIRFYGVRLPGLATLYPWLPRRLQLLPALRYDGRIGWQGIVPSRADKMASLSVDTGLAKLGDAQDFYRQLQPERIAGHLADVLAAQIDTVLDQVMSAHNPQLWADTPPRLKQAAYSRVRRQLPRILADLTAAIGANIDQLLDPKLMVMRYFEARPELLNELFLLMGRKELRFIRNFGFYLGFPLGFVLVAIVSAYPHWYVLPIGGVLIGWTVNYLGITMIFEPVRPRWWLPWRQGLMIKRQDEITRHYAKLVSENVITLHNVGSELLTGPSSDRTLELMHESLRPAVDAAIGPARVAVRAALGPREYEVIRGALAEQASALAPEAFADDALNRRQARRIGAYIDTRMRQLGPADFVDMLRSAIRQDEWLLFLHGGVLGLFAGLVHLAVFGV